MAAKHLVLFATSDSPDPYVNSIAHAVVHLGASSIEVVVISEHDYPTDLSGGAWSTHISERVTAQLEALSTGSYINYAADKNGSIREPLAASDKSIYAKVLKEANIGGIGAKVVPLSDLSSALSKWVRGEKICLFDVTALKKNLLVDVVISVLALDYDEVFTFELKRPPSFGQADLFHVLSSPADYVYRNVLGSGPVMESVSRLRRLSVRSRAVGLVATVLLVLSLVLFFWNPASKVLALVGVISAIASIVSACYPFILRFRD